MDLLNFDKLAAGLDVAAIASVIFLTYAVRWVFPKIPNRFIILVPLGLGVAAYIALTVATEAPFKNPIELFKYAGLSTLAFKLTKDLLTPEKSAPEGGKE